MTVSSPGKGITSPSLGTSFSYMPRVMDPEAINFFIMMQSLSLCLMG
jgi:hypothetical protein